MLGDWTFFKSHKYVVHSSRNDIYIYIMPPNSAVLDSICDSIDRGISKQKYVVEYSRAGPSSCATRTDCRGPSAGMALFYLWIMHAISLEFACNVRSSWDSRFSIPDGMCWRTEPPIWSPFRPALRGRLVRQHRRIVVVGRLFAHMRLVFVCVV